MKDTAQRILDAAIQVFGRDGVSGATTREIARRAKVNEVTLFRHFKNKDELLRQVVVCSSKQFSLVFEDAPYETAADVRRTIDAFAAAYTAKLSKNEEFVRTFFGEMKRHQKLCRQLFVLSSQSVRQRFIAYLTKAQDRKLLRANLDVITATDALTGMLFSGVMRRPLTKSIYSHKAYVITCVELFWKGIEP